MKTILKIIILPVLLLNAQNVFTQELSQTTTLKKINPCESDTKYQAFDFWLGQFAVYGDLEKKKPQAGKNSIVKQQKGCLIVENWAGSKGSIGTSMNYYDGTKDKWVQHWMSADGTTINIEGNILNGSMILVGKIYYVKAKKDNIRDFKGTWTPLENGVVRQFFEESIDSGKTWYPWFEGFYFPE